MIESSGTTVEQQMHWTVVLKLLFTGHIKPITSYCTQDTCRYYLVSLVHLINLLNHLFGEPFLVKQYI